MSNTEAYLPVLEALQAMVDGDVQHTLRRLMVSHAPAWYLQVAPLESAILPELAVAMAGTPGRLKREFCAFLHQVSRVSPVILFLDDLHWADDATVDLLAYIAPRCVAMRVLLLSTFRPSDLVLAHHPFCEIKLELQTRRVYREIDLPLLSQEDVGCYLAMEFDGALFLPAFRSGAPWC